MDNSVKQIILLSIPIISTFLAQKCIQITNTFMLGHVGAQELAAGSLFMSLYTLLIVISMGIFNGINVLISKELGTKSTNKISVYFIHGLLVALIMSVLMFLCLWYLPLLLFNIKEYNEIAMPALILSRAAAVGMPGTILYLLLRETMTAFKLPRINFYVVLSAIPLLIMLDYYFVFISQLDSMHKIAVIGYANAFIEWFMAIVLSICCLKIRLINNILFNFKTFKLSIYVLREILRIGLPAGIIFVLDVGLVLVAGLLSGYFGAINLSAYQIVLQYTTISYMLPLGVGFATATLISHMNGANNTSAIKELFRSSIAIGILGGIFFLLIFICFARELSMFFIAKNSPDLQDILNYSTKFFIIVGIIQLFDAVLVIATGALRGLGDVLKPMYYAIFSYWFVGFTSMVVLSFIFSFSGFGVLIGICIATILASILILIRAIKRILL